MPTEHDDVGGLWTERSGIRLENEDGAWVGTASTQVLEVGVTLGWATWELAGEGDYEGLAMFLHGDGRLHGAMARPGCTGRRDRPQRECARYRTAR